MAPDLNSLPSSPQPDRTPTTLQTSQSSSRTTSRPVSQQMGPPSAPAAHGTHPQQHRSLVSPSASTDQMGAPIRHPRPMTPAELALELEKEQEAVVNRLIREMAALRAQTASVASNASHSSASTSASLLPIDITDTNPTHQMTGATHPTPSRRHRSSSSLSTRSMTNVAHGAHGAGAGNNSVSGMSQASAARAAAAGGTGTSGTSTPARQSLDIARHNLPSSLPQRPSLSREPSSVSQSNQSAAAAAAHAGTAHTHPHPLPSPLHSPNQMIASQHLTDMTAIRTEMEAVKAENEMLRQRVRALERAFRAGRRDSSNSDAARPEPHAAGSGGERERPLLNVVSGGFGSTESRPSLSPAGVAAWAAGDGGVGGVAGPRERSESQSTTASSRRGVAADDEVKVGESAGSAGVLRGG